MRRRGLNSQSLDELFAVQCSKMRDLQKEVGL